MNRIASIGWSICMATLAGCSTLHVDVDVYKGPLMNHPQSQVDQVVDMALGARPLIEVVYTDLRQSGPSEGNLVPYENAFLEGITEIMAYYEDPSEVIDTLENMTKPSSESFEFGLDKTRAALEKLKAKAPVAAWGALAMIDRDLKPLINRSEAITKAKASINQQIQRLSLRPCGLRNLHARYLSTRQGRPTPHDECQCRSEMECRDRLFDGLLELSERARVLGNASTMFLPLAGDHTAPWSDGVPSDKAKIAEKFKRAAEVYVPVLQFIGNSIHDQIDDIRKYEAARDLKQMKALADIEQQLVRSNVALGGKSVLQEVDEAIMAALNAPKWLTDLRRALLDSAKEGKPGLETATGQLARGIAGAQGDIKGHATSLEQIQQVLDKVGKNTCLDKLVGKKNQEEVLGVLKDPCGIAESDLKLVPDLFSGEKEETAPVQDRILAALKKRVAETSQEKSMAEARLVRYEHWRTRLALGQGGTGVSAPLLDDIDKPLTAIDALIATLQHMQINAVLEADETRRSHLEKALDYAQARRANLMHLVPAVSYLRSSQPASAYVDGSKQREDFNLLWKRAKVGFPNFSQSLTPDEDMDKQYWHPVNRIRVTGGGNMNYALVKDDVGNWYVKGFESDKKDIYQSFKKLAAYNMKGELGTVRAMRQKIAKAKGLDVSKATVHELVKASEDESLNAGGVGDVLRVSLGGYAKQLIRTHTTLKELWIQPPPLAATDPASQSGAALDSLKGVLSGDKANLGDFQSEDKQTLTLMQAELDAMLARLKALCSNMNDKANAACKSGDRPDDAKAKNVASLVKDALLAHQRGLNSMEEHLSLLGKVTAVMP